MMIVMMIGLKKGRLSCMFLLLVDGLGRSLNLRTRVYSSSKSIPSTIVPQTNTGVY